MKKILAFMMIISIAFSLYAKKEPQVVITYEKPLNKKDNAIQQDILNSQINQEFKNFIHENFKIDKNINLSYGYQDGPMFLSKNNTIYIPYSFIKEVNKRFKNKYKKEMKDKVYDSLLHTLFHELAHLLINMYEIPVVGKEEDAADSLANIILLEFYEKGAEITKNAAELFLLESASVKVFNKFDFWDEHSLDIQRYYSTMCYIYGSDTKKNSSIKEELKYDKYRSEFCEEEYEILTENWSYLLEPFLKK